MRDGIRRHLNATSALAVLALVLAMTGGAWAAKRFVITSVRQLSPSVRKALKGANGVNGTDGKGGAPGAPGAQGPAGAAGSRGETGPPGSEGKEGPAGKNGLDGTNGQNGSPWTAGGTLPSGSTESGTWSAVRHEVIGFEEVRAAISFFIPLAAGAEGKNAFYLNLKESEEAEVTKPHGCGGSVKNPTAPKGALCVYTSEEESEKASGVHILFPGIPGSPNSFGRPGTFISITGESTGSEPAQIVVAGSWAVTAP